MQFNSTPVAQKVFPREAYRDQGQPDASTVLDQTPGAFVARPFDENLAMPNVPVYPLVRGGLPYETPVALDGDTVSLPSTGTFDLSLIPTYVLQEVEIVKGPGDPGDMGDGVNGGINLQTAQPTVERRGMLEFEGDSHGGQFSDLAYDGTMPGGKLSFATMLSIDGSPGPLGGLSLPGDPASDSLRKALLVELHAMPSNAVTITGTVLATNLDRALAGAYGAMLGNDFVSLAPALGARQDERLRFEQIAAQFGEGRDQFQTRVFGFDLSNDGYDESSSLSQALDRERGVEAAWDHASGPNEYVLSVSASGSAAEEEDYTSFAAFGESLPQGSSRANARARFNATLHPSMRTELDLMAQTVTDEERVGYGSVQNWSRADARAGLSQLLAPQVSLRASVGASGVAPPLDMLANTYAPQLSVGLAPEFFSFSSDVTREEYSRGADVGLEWRLHGNTTTLSFDVYGTHVNDAYVLAATQPLPPVISLLWENAPPMDDEGVEVSLVQFKPVGLGFIVQAALPRTYLEGPLSQNVAGIPYAQGYGEISYKWPRGSRASFGVLYSGANNPYGRGPFVTCNSNLELSVGAKSKFQISAENIFGSLGGRIPIAFAGIPALLPNGTFTPTGANVLGPPTVRVMFRQSFGRGSIYEH